MRIATTINPLKVCGFYRSRNLRDWEFIKDILTDRSDPDLNYAKIERPKIIHNNATGQYIMWMHKEGGDNYGQARAAVAVADRIDGDYEHRGSFRPLNHMSRDCAAFVDDEARLTSSPLLTRTPIFTFTGSPTTTPRYPTWYRKSG